MYWHKIYVTSFQHGGTNFTAFTIIDNNRQEVKDVVRQIVTNLRNSQTPIEIPVHIKQ